MKTLRIAVGPFAGEGGDDWPVYGYAQLGERGYDIVPFSDDDPIHWDVDATVWWSPEYHTVSHSHALPGYTVAVVGDWQVVPFERIPGLAAFDLIATDLRGVRRLMGMGKRLRGPPLWFRQFSFDPRLHAPEDEDTATGRSEDVAFVGRSVPGRDALLERVDAWCQRAGRDALLSIAPFERGYEAEVYCRSKIVLGYAQRGELQMRAYEAMACGALYVVQHDCEEVFASGAPIPTYDPAHVEEFLEAWLADEAALNRQRLIQQQWVAQETPVAHLGWLCDRIRERLSEREGARGMAVVVPAVAGGADRVGVGAGGAADEPPLNEQRRECAELVPFAAKEILDLGCAAGGFGWWLKQRVYLSAPGPHVTGVDSSPDVAADRRLDEVHLWDLDSPWEGRQWAKPGHYEAVTLLDVLEHVLLPTTVLARVRPLLTRDGCVVASIPQVRNGAVLHDLITQGRWRYHTPGLTPFLGPQSNLLCAQHVRFFCREDIELMFARAGYRVERVEATRMSAPGLERWLDDVAFLAAHHGADADKLRDELSVLQWLVVARPDWDAVATEGV